MHIWTLDNWEKYYCVLGVNCRAGARLRIDKDVDPEVRRACKEFLAWLRTEYHFPIRVPIYLRAPKQIKANDGEMVSATCLLPDDRYVEPYIRVAVGDYEDAKGRRGQDNALAGILRSIAHELSHYFQWVNDIQLTEVGIERQASKYADIILDEYAKTREHP